MGIGTQRLGVRVDQGTHQQLFAGLATVGICCNGFVKDGPILVAIISSSNGAFLEIMAIPNHVTDSGALWL